MVLSMKGSAIFKLSVLCNALNIIKLSFANY